MPRVARALLAALIPPDEQTAVLRDLDEEYTRHVRPHRGPVAAHAWYWRQVLGSVRPALAMRRRRGGMGDRTSRDMLFALRSLRRRPALAAAAVATLGLGIGANTAMFSVVDAVLLRPLPFAEPERLVQIWSANPRGIPRNSMSPPNFFELRDQAIAAGALSAAAAFTAGEQMTLRIGEPLRVLVSTVSSSFFETLGVQPSIGRGFVAADGLSGAPTVAIVSDELWRTGLAASPLPVEVSLSGAPATVVGVMPPAFAFPSPAVNIWMPLEEGAGSGSRSAHYLDVVARLHGSVDPTRASATLQAIAARLEATYPEVNRGWGVTVLPLQEALTGDARRPLLLLLGAVGCVLLIACANVAGLLLANGQERSHEFAVRTALGATPARLITSQLIESLILAALGGALAVVLAQGALGILAQVDELSLPRRETITLDLRVLAMTAAAVLVTGLLAGLAPALRASKVDPELALKASRGVGAGGAARRTRTMLVAAQIAVTLALTIGAGLLLKSYARLTRVDPGFDSRNVLLAQVALGAATYEPEQWSSYVSRGLDGLDALPGVVAAGAASPLPLAGREGLMRFGVRIDGRPAPADGRSDRTYLRWATPGYFAAIGIPLLQGRPFEDRDDSRAPSVAVVDRTFVDRYLPGEEPVGRGIVLTNERGRVRTIIGVVGPVRQTALDRAADPHVYIPHAQNPAPTMTFVIRTAIAPALLIQPVRERLRSVDPLQPVYNVRTGAEMVSGTVAARSFNTMLLGLFADLAGLLTVIGVYGLMASWVAESKKELGVRLALGAASGDVLAMVVGRGLRLTAVGIAIGLPIALLGSGVLRSLLFEVPPRDLSTYVVACGMLLLVGVAGSYLPARRAVAINPVDSLRTD